MWFSGVYLFNMFCAMVPCSVTQPPPQAFIAEPTTPFPSQPIPISMSSIYKDFEGDGGQNLRSKRLLIPSQSRSQSQSQRRSRKISEFEYEPKTEVQSQRSGVRSSKTSPVKGEGLTSMLFQAIPAIPLLLNNFNNMMRNGEKSKPVERYEGQGTRVNRGQPISAPYVTTDLGALEGYYMGTMKGRRIVVFEGIPYAEPPIGKLRFRAPLPKRPWKTNRAATKVGNVCLQAHPTDFFRVTGSEDCLYLNIYSPVIPGNSDLGPLPVIFLIHGGSFQYGSSGEYGPSYLLDEDVILVTANYRLGPLGFLSTGDGESPGNYGLKDQALALKWTYENILQFGGDNQRITIMGQSAGAVSAHLHLISNKTTAYFAQGVSLSGSCFGFWPISSPKKARDLSRRLATLLRCPNSSSKELVRCLRGSNPHFITAAQMQLYEWIPFHPLVLFSPVIESASDPSAFLTKSPEDAYEANEVEAKPWIFGQTSQEGHFDIYFMKLMMQTASIALNGRKYLPLILDYGGKSRKRNEANRLNVPQVTDKLLKFYGGSMLGRGIDIFAISDMYTDRYYTSTIRKALKAHSAIAPNSTYAYVFDFKGKYNLGSLFGSQEPDWGVSHTEDMFYYFNSSVYHHGLQRGDTEYELSQLMTDYLANFAATGTPSHINSNGNEVRFWDPAKAPFDFDSAQGPTFTYLQIRRNITMIRDPFERRIKFWEGLEYIDKDKR